MVIEFREAIDLSVIGDSEKESLFGLTMVVEEPEDDFDFFAGGFRRLKSDD